MAIDGEQLSNLVVNEVRRVRASPATHYVGLDRAALLYLSEWMRRQRPFAFDPADLQHRSRGPFYGFDLREDPFAPPGVVLVRLR